MPELSCTIACMLMVFAPLITTFLECTQYGVPSVDLHAAPVVPHLHTPSSWQKFASVPVQDLEETEHYKKV